jgi:hypothetical protein
MNKETAYAKGFIKRAVENGYSENEAINLLKESGVINDIGSSLATGAKDFFQENIKDPVRDVREGLANVFDPNTDAGFTDAWGNSAFRRADNLQSDAFNKATEGLKNTFKLPEHIARYGQNNLKPEDTIKAVQDTYQGKYDTDVFNREHPTLAGIGKWLTEHNINPQHAALAAGGAGLLAGGYGLAKLLGNNKPKEEEQEQEPMDPRMFMPPPPPPPQPQRGPYNIVFN